MPLLKEIETLARLHRDGVLSDTEFAAAKTAILEEVPEAQSATPLSRAGAEAAALLARCLVPPVAAGGLVFALGIPGTLSLTLGVTVLAAIVIAQFRRTGV